ncbi:replication initiator protein A [Streptococcus pneumoniae]|nr:replication initiator protein A [Streptococcus pneumoniae]
MKRITANQYQTSERYYKLPKILFEDEKYTDMKLEVKVAYSILKDRLELSLSRGWIDEEGAVYLVFSNSKLMKLLGCSKSKLLSIKKILKEYDLIDEVQQSSSEKGRLANKIYLGELSSTPVGNSNTPSVKKRLGQKVEKVTKYDRDYIWGLVQDQFRREGFSETASEIAMTDFERIYQYALDNVRFVRRAEVLAEFVFNGLYSVWNNRVRKGGG